MTREELVRQIQKKLSFDLTQKEVGSVLSAAFSILMSYFVESDDDDASFNIKGFGTLFKMSYGGHKFFNPKSLKWQMMDDKRTIKFKCSKVFKKKL